MKIAIIGGGFYGSFLAYRLQDFYKVTLFEESNDLMTKSAILNQCRLHQGFHYPRSIETMKQTGIGYYKFLNDFGNFTEKINDNIYAIKKTLDDKKSSTFDLLKNNLNHEIEFKTIASHFLVKNCDEYSHFLRVDERLILLDKLKQFFKEKIKCHICLNVEVTDVDPDTGKVFFDNHSENFDLIINTTYIMPNMGLNIPDNFTYSYELAAMVCVDIPNLKSTAMTIIDGDYVSLYPNYEKQYTISSVTFTPFYKTKNWEDFKKALLQKDSLANDLKVKEKILNHADELLNLPSFQSTKVWIAPKVKIDPDINDYRAGEIKTHQKVISVFCAKLDSVYAVHDGIMKYIERVL